MDDHHGFHKLLETSDPRALSPDDWLAMGRGRSFTFYAVDTELASWLADLPPDLGPYELVGRRLQKSRYTAWECPLPAADFVGRGTFQIRSISATPDWSLEPAETLTERAFFAGMVQVSHGAVDRLGRQLESIISVRPTFRNRATGETLRYEAYERVYDALRKRIKRDLGFSTRLMLQDGRYVPGVTLMSNGSKAAWDAGSRFHAEPAGPVGEPSDRA